MGSAADALSDLTGVKPKAPPTVSQKLNLTPDDTGSAANALRSLYGIDQPSATPQSSGESSTFADRFSPAEERPLEKRGNGFEWSRAITDIPSEIANEAKSGVNDIAALSRRGEMGPIEGIAATGRAAIAPLKIVASPITGAARSLVGHTMANAEHGVGGIIAPDVAKRDNPEQMYQTAKGDVDTAMSALRAKSPSEVISAATAKVQAAPRSIAELKELAAKGYEHPDLVGLEVKPEAIQNFALKSELELTKKGLNDVTAPKVISVLRRAQEAPDGTTVTGQNIVSLRRSLGEIAGEGGSEAKAAKTAIDHLDEWMPNIKPDHVINGDPQAAFGRLEQANADYSAAKHAELVDQKLLRAELRSASAHSGMGVTNQVRGRMADILINPKERRGFSDEELAQMEKIVYGTTGQNLLRGASNVLSGGGGVGSTLLGIMTGGTFPALGMALRHVSNKITIGQAEKLSELIRSRSGLSASADKFEEAANAFKKGRSARTVAGINMAARNLSNNLQSAGLSLSVSDLLKGLDQE
jgi:hypothetical protein